MADEPLNPPIPTSLDSLEIIDAICDKFEVTWQKGEQPKIEAFLQLGAEHLRDELFAELLRCEFQLLEKGGLSPHQQNYLDRFPDYPDIIRDGLGRYQATCETGNGGDQGTSIGNEPADIAAMPASIGRFQVKRQLGSGAFGSVFLAHDDQLDRDVAIKVPHDKYVAVREYVELYRQEAQTAAHLEKHAHIVTVYQVDGTAEHPFFVVAQYVDGEDLRERLGRQRYQPLEAAQLVAAVAEALAFAHQHGVVHRDVKPANILLDAGGEPYLADFGLALREQESGTGPRFVGTPHYMSPEQARNEGHRVDGRSDIFALGIVLYELLAGRRPFRGDSQQELLDEISLHEPKPPRQIDGDIPRELERICLKALAKRLTERYTAAQDMAEDLRLFVAGRVATAPTQPRLEQPTKSAVVPRGLRCFDEQDADFFLDLLPGARDRNGLPESIAFWKSRIETSDPERTFSVGLIYGPSGCGKTSLVRAGLLPRLTGTVTAVYVEATTTDTEQRLLGGLLRKCPALSRELSLVDAIAALRRGEGGVGDGKIVLVIDQFEQWLHAHGEDDEAALIQALRQCDGERVQCLLLVRDDFWMAITRCMAALDVAPIPGNNVAAVDLFDHKHARRVLERFGRAYEALPTAGVELQVDQQLFLDEAISALAEDGKIVCVRLALFAEMVKSKPWTPATLKDIGGAAGVGVTFLEETFSSRAANPRHRLQQQPARRVLALLLPEAGSNIKGHLRAADELQAAAGPENRPGDFADLLHILDSELRLITPTDPAGSIETDETNPIETTPAGKFYQLTHDYLVPALRQWLTRKQKETRRGRAELRLAERSQLWIARPEIRNLPSLREYLNVRLFTRRRNWTDSQRKMMRRAALVHVLRSSALVATVLAVTYTGVKIRNSVVASIAAENRKRDHQLAESLVEAVMTAQAEALPQAIQNLEPLRNLAKLILRERFGNSSVPATPRLHVACALTSLGEFEGYESIVSSINDAPSGEAANIVAALKYTRERSVESLRQQAEQANSMENWSLKTRLAIVALHLGDPAIAADMCEFRSDPIQRTSFIVCFSDWHSSLAELAALAEPIDNAQLRSGICLAIGGVPIDQLPPEAIQAWQKMLTEWHQSQPESSTHSASGWTLRKWQLPLPHLPVGLPRPTTAQQSAIVDINEKIAATRKAISDQYEIWDRNLSKKQTDFIGSLDEGLISHYRLDESDGVVAANSVEEATDSTYQDLEKNEPASEVNPPPAEPLWTHGIVGNAIRLNGTGHLTSGRPLELEADTSFSYGCWFFATAGPPMVLLSQRDREKGFRGFDLSFDVDSKLRATISGTDPTMNSTPGADYAHSCLMIETDFSFFLDTVAPAWRHIVVTYDGSRTAKGLAIYVDGVREPTTIIFDAFVGVMQCNVPFHIGSRHGDYRAIGAIDDVRVYKRLLAPNEVTALYRSGIASLGRMAVGVRTAPQQETLAAARRSDESIVKLRGELDALLASLLVPRISGRSWFVNTLDMTMIKIPAGGFVREEGGSKHSVTLPRAFWMSDREICVQHFQQFMEDESCKQKPIEWPGSGERKGDHPLVEVTWYDAVQFCNWLSDREGLARCYVGMGRGWTPMPDANGYRLPSDTEWDYACLANTTTDYYFGNISSLIAKHAVISEFATQPCGSKLPNSWGLFDMLGNVSEWCGKWGAKVSDPMTPSREATEILRGGSFSLSMQFLMMNYPNTSPPNFHFNDLGFRVVRSHSE